MCRKAFLTLADDGRLGVRVVDNGRVALRPVQIIYDDQNGAVVTGLAASEMVIVRGGEYTRDGREVEFEMEQMAGTAPSFGGEQLMYRFVTAAMGRSRAVLDHFGGIAFWAACLLI